MECSAHGYPIGFHLSCDIENIEYYQLDENIYVYKNLLKNCKKLESLINFSEKHSNGELFFSKWIDWYKYGTYSDSTNGEILYNSDTLNRYKNLSSIKKIDYIFDAEYELYIALRKATSTALRHYVNAKQIQLPSDWYITYPTLAKYHAGFTIDEYNHVMNFHTDYNIRDHWFPGEKFFLTCTTYINDNYCGGEICFYRNKNIIKYKPEAGDILVFPSGNPVYGFDELYYHGVNKVENNYKILIRTYLKYISFYGYENWKLCEQVYGSDWIKLYKNLNFINNIDYTDIEKHRCGIIEKLLPEKYCKVFDIEVYKNLYEQ